MKITKIFETGKDSNLKLTEVSVEDRIQKDKRAICFIAINENEKHQIFKGFGGALTESAGYVLSKLPEDKQNKIVADFYDSEKGLGYTYGRTHMNSCDFSLENWACVPEKDETLKSFSMERTDKYITPLMKKAKEICTDGLKVMITPWSPPAWMKDNNDMNNGGHLKREYWQLWADYFVKFIQELQNRGFDVNLLSVQNEAAAVQTWDSCIWSAEEEGEFATKYLGPTLEKAGLKDIGILVWDHNRDIMWDRFSTSMAQPDADKYIAGVAFHWYSGDQYENVKKCADTYPSKQIVFSEGCVEGGPRNGAWYTGERYAHNIINDLNNGCTTWIDWNIVLDMQGGPNHVGNYCDAPILIDTEKGEAHYQSSFYSIGHFSRFIKPGAQRLTVNIGDAWIPTNIDGKITNTVESCAFKNPDNSIAMVLTNRTEMDIFYKMQSEDGPVVKIPAKSIQTLLIEL